ncbi:MAG: hypothetical protein O2910_03880 [Proteobacteria bacterium]|nr:hypothetical protein [Pseudomonadota bacterium]
MQPFDLFIGIDWSGARTEALPNMAVAQCPAGDAAPQLVANQQGGQWSRPALAHWLLDLARSGQRVLCGADFSFCFPHVDMDAYFPGLEGMPDDVAGMWAVLEATCASDAHFGASGFIDDPHFGSHFFSRGSGRDRFRVTEQACRDQGLGRPETIFKIVGAKQVAKSSLTGMRVLNWLKNQQNSVAIWPFDPISPDTDTKFVFVETYPAAFARLADNKGGKIRKLDPLNAIMTLYEAKSVHLGGQVSTLSTLSDNHTDALITAAALRFFSTDESVWNPAGLSDRVRRTEGWTFGIR